MAMEQPARKFGAKKFGDKKGKFGGKGKFEKKDGAEGSFARMGDGRYTPKLLGKAYFQRKKGCPFSGPRSPKIDYKDVRLLGKYLSDYGKILPRHLTGICAAKQRELSIAIKRARMLALMPFAGKDLSYERPARPAGERGSFRGERRERNAAPEATTAPAAE